MDKYQAMRILGLQEVEGYISADMVKKAYRKMSKKYHPDTGGDAEKFKEIVEAYELIKEGTTNTISHYDIVDILTVIKVR